VLGKKGPRWWRRTRSWSATAGSSPPRQRAAAWQVPAARGGEPLVVMDGNQALGLGILAAGMEVVAMYPITPATSVSHYLARAFPRVGGFLHQAEDEIAAIGFAIGASYAGKTACTITSGPGLALKTEFLGLAVMAEIPLVVINVQRGGPSTGLPTKVEQGDLLAALYGQPGDTPKIVLAPATIEECFHFVVLARKLAEEFRGPVLVLTDANLATGVSSFPRPRSIPSGSRRRSTSRPGPRTWRRTTGTRAPGCRCARSPASAAASTWSPASPTPAKARSPTTRPRTRRAARCARASSRRSADPGAAGAPRRRRTASS
jgi:sulfopyruvate decarboxylase TPP-binding subunit